MLNNPPASEFIETTEVGWEDGARIINECDYLYAIGVREIEELTLGLTIAEAKKQAPILETDDKSPWAFLKLGGQPIETDDTCRLFEVLFDRNHLISYTILNESYGKYPEPPEEFTGKLFRIFSRSHLLDFTQRTTYASGGHPAPLLHFEIACLNHVIDVICTAPPKIAVGNRPKSSSIVN